MRDGLAARHLLLRSLDIDMDPLVVAGGIGEFVDLFLGHRVPVADPDLPADIGGEIGPSFDFQHGLLLLLLLNRRPRGSGGPGATARRLPWVPAFAGMTKVIAHGRMQNLLSP